MNLLLITLKNEKSMIFISANIKSYCQHKNFKLKKYRKKFTKFRILNSIVMLMSNISSTRQTVSVFRKKANQLKSS